MDTRPRIVVGAYPTYVGAPELVAGIIADLADNSDVGGLELPWSGTVSVPDGCPGHWRHVVTCIPGTMGRLGQDPAYGLASPDADGRRQALADLRGVRDEVERLGTVRAVEIHSAPTRTAHGPAFGESLAEVTEWDWGTTTLVVEHCDRWREAATVQKGFLSYEAELAVVTGLTGRTPVRMGINWGRSVIESEAVTTPEAQAAAAATVDRLGALMFSSVSNRVTAFGAAWLDAHLAPADTSSAEPGTLLTEAHLRRCLRAAGPSYEGIVGIKVGVKPETLTAAQRAARLLEVVALVVEAAT